MAHCHGFPVRFEWGSQTRLALTGLNFMLDRIGGIHVRLWSIAPKFEKKLAPDAHARQAGYHFIRDHGPRSNNRNQFMEWTDDQIQTPGGPLEGWSEGKGKEALDN